MNAAKAKRGKGPMPSAELAGTWTRELGVRVQEVRDGAVTLVELEQVKQRMSERRTARRARAAE